MLKRLGEKLAVGAAAVVGGAIGAVYGLLAALIEIALGTLALYATIFVPLLLVGFALTVGTDGLMALGLSRHVAGSIVTVIVVIGCVAGLYGFAKHGIDWD